MKACHELPEARSLAPMELTAFALSHTRTVAGEYIFRPALYWSVVGAVLWNLLPPSLLPDQNCRWLTDSERQQLHVLFLMLTDAGSRLHRWM